MNLPEDVWAYCGLTCRGGSECRQCPCEGPNDCEMKAHPDFEKERRAAVRRMTDWLLDAMFVKKPDPGSS